MLFAVSIESLENLNFIFLAKKTLVLSVICSKCKNEGEMLINKEDSIEIFKILEIYNYFKSMAEENISQGFRLNNVDKTRKEQLLQSKNRSTIEKVG